MDEICLTQTHYQPGHEPTRTRKELKPHDLKDAELDALNSSVDESSLNPTLAMKTAKAANLTQNQ
jgi:hypothetical protein